MTIKLSQEENLAFRIIEGVYKSYQNFDPQGIEEVQLEEYSVWDGTLPQLFKSRSEVKDFHKKDQENTKARGEFSFSIRPLKVDIEGNVAVVLSSMEAEWKEPNAWKANMRITDVMKKVNGKWMMWHHHESVEPDGYSHI